MQKKISILLNKMACSRRILDARTLYEKYFKLHNVETIPSEKIENADFVIIITCAFHNESVDYSIELYEYAKQFIKEENIIIMGCLSSISPELLKDSKSYKVSPKDYINVDNLFMKMGVISSLKTPFIKMNTGGDLINKSDSSHRHRSYYINVAEGCSGYCAYCVIKKAIGQTKSKMLNDILIEVNNAIDDGYTTIYLGSEDLGAYGLDIGLSFPLLLKEILDFVKLKNCKSFKIDLRNTINPKWTIKYFDEILNLLIQHKNVFPVYSCALQSGSDRILSLSKRECNTLTLLSILDEIKKYRQDIYMTGQLIIGLPTEEELDLLCSVDFISNSAINFWTCFKYSINPHSLLSKLYINWNEKNVEFNWQLFLKKIEKIKDSKNFIKKDSLNRVYIVDSVNSEYMTICSTLEKAIRFFYPVQNDSLPGPKL